MYVAVRIACAQKLSEFCAGLLMFQLQLTAPFAALVTAHDAELKVTRVGSGVAEMSMMGRGAIRSCGAEGDSPHPETNAIRDTVSSEQRRDVIDISLRGF